MSRVFGLSLFLLSLAASPALAQTVSFVDAWGSAVESYGVAERAHVRVEDSNAHGTVQVTVRSGFTGDQETLVLQETAGGVFAGSLPLEPLNFLFGPIPGDGRLQSHPVDQIETFYNTASDRALIFYASARFIDEAGKPAGEVLAGGVARVRVLYPSIRGEEPVYALNALVRSRDGADEEIVIVRETPPGSGVWDGEVRLVTSPPGGGIPYNGQLETSVVGPAFLGDELTVTYQDGAGRAVTIPSRVRFLDRFGRLATTFAVSDRVGVRVETHEQKDPLTKGTIQVQVREAGGGDSETVELTETGLDTDVYEGGLGSASSPAVAADGVLQADPGSVIEAERQNETTPHTTVAQATMSAASVLFVDADGLPAEVYLEGTRAYVRVVDSFASGAAYAVLESVLGGDSESLTLTQTSPNVYEGSIELRSASAIPGNGFLEVQQDSLRVSYGSPAVTDAAGTVGSRTWFVDAYGNPTGRYSIGSRAYVRVEDHNAHGTLQVAVRSGFTGDQETLVLQETGDGGIFAGSLPLEWFNTSTGPVPGDGTIQAHVIDQIEALHASSSARALTAYASALFIDEDGKPTGEVLENGVARVRVLYQSRYGEQTISALVRSRDGADQEVVTLSETYSDSRIWEGEVQLFATFPPGSGIPYNGTLETSAVGPEGVGDELIVNFQDGKGRAVTILPRNAAPTAENDVAATEEDQAVDIAVLANDGDPDGDPLSVLDLGQPANGAVTLAADGTVTYIPAPDFAGLDSFTYVAADPDGASSSATVTVAVSPVNDAPVANGDAAPVAEDGSVAIDVLANDADVDGAALTVVAVTQGAHGTVTLDPVTYTPAADYNGADAFTYTISDGAGGTATATVAIAVTAVNDAPIAVDDSAATLSETPVAVAVLANDTDVDSAALTVIAVTQGAHGTVTFAPVTYTPAAGYTGADTFTYTISDGAGGTAAATVRVDVQAPPRVSGNLQVLYTFDEGSGTAVHDVSGVGAPLDLTVKDPSAVTWLPGALSLDSTTLVESAGAAAKVIGACQASDEVTVEAWVVPSDLVQAGPAPIVTMSQNPNKRNVTLGQSGTAWSGRLRTTVTDKVGAQTDAAGTAGLGLTHVVYTRSSTGAVRIYVAGAEVASGTVAGTLAAWEGFELALGGELAGPRYWRGELHLVAIYSRALTAAEVRQNWLAGAN